MMKRVIDLLLLLMTIACCCESKTVRVTDSCDWIGSGTRQMALSRGVQPVYLRCTQGTVRWLYPQGALRITLRHGTTESDFRACLRLSDVTSGARLYLAGRRKLHPVFREGDPADLVRCVTSRDGHVALYAEGDPVPDATRRSTFEFRYHLKKVERKNGMDVHDECQPCTEEQLLRNYCSSDFVIRGTVSSLQHNSALRRSEVSVRVSRIHRTNELLELPLAADSKVASLAEHVVLHRPLNCGTRSGTGEYLFLGKWVLGNPELTCAPRMTEWKKVRRKALRNGVNECLLDDL